MGEEAGGAHRGLAFSAATVGSPSQHSAIAFKTRPGTLEQTGRSTGLASHQAMKAEKPTLEPMRCAIVVDGSLPAGRAANAAAVIALTIGKRHPELAGTDLIDGSEQVHPGLIPIGITVLGASATDLGELRTKALKLAVDVVDFSVHGQQTNDYSEFCARVRALPSAQLAYVGVGIYGPRKLVGRVVGKFCLLR